MEKRESHKGCSVFLPCHLFIPLCCTPDLQEAHPRAWDETHSVTCFPSKCCMISFLDVFIDHHGYEAAAQFPLCGSEEFRAATHPEGFSVLTIPSFTFLCEPGCSYHPLLRGKSATRLEYFLSSCHACPLWLDRDLGTPLCPKQATLQLLKSSATSSTLPSCWSFSLSLERLSESKESLCLNPHLSLSKSGVLHIH